MGYNKPSWAYFDNIIVMETLDDLYPLTCDSAPPASEMVITE